MRDVEESAGIVVVDVTMKQLSAVFGLLADLFCADVDNRNKENESDNVAFGLHVLRATLSPTIFVFALGGGTLEISVIRAVEFFTAR